MNTTFVACLFKTLKSLFLLLAYQVLVGSLFAGVLLMKDKEAKMGTLVESANTVSLQTQYGTVDYEKEVLLWYSAEQDIDTFFKAAQRARAEGNVKAAMILFEVSLAKENAFQLQAAKELSDLKEAMGKRKSINSVGGIPESTTNDSNTLVTDGETLRAEHDLKVIEPKAQQVAGVDKADVIVDQKIQESVGHAKLSQKISQYTNNWTREEKLVNIVVIGVFVLLIFIFLWRIAMVD